LRRSLTEELGEDVGKKREYAGVVGWDLGVERERERRD